MAKRIVFGGSFVESVRSPFVIGVIGKSDAGKSSFINAVLAKQEAPTKRADDIGSTTTEFKHYTTTLHNGQQVILVDTPGFEGYHFFGDSFSDHAILQGLKESVENRNVNLSCIMVIMDVRSGFVRNLAPKARRTLGEIITRDAATRVVMVTTHWDEMLDCDTNRQHITEAEAEEQEKDYLSNAGDVLEDAERHAKDDWPIPWVSRMGSQSGELNKTYYASYRSGFSVRDGGDPVVGYIPPKEMIYKMLGIEFPKVNLLPPSPPASEVGDNKEPVDPVQELINGTLQIQAITTKHHELLQSVCECDTRFEASLSTLVNERTKLSETLSTVRAEFQQFKEDHERTSKADQQTIRDLETERDELKQTIAQLKVNVDTLIEEKREAEARRERELHEKDEAMKVELERRDRDFASVQQAMNETIAHSKDMLQRSQNNAKEMQTRRDKYTSEANSMQDADTKATGTFSRVLDAPKAPPATSQVTPMTRTEYNRRPRMRASEERRPGHEGYYNPRPQYRSSTDRN